VQGERGSRYKRESRVLSIDCGVTVTDAHSIAPSFFFYIFPFQPPNKIDKKKEERTLD
jgi:hypothetical protein